MLCKGPWISPSGEITHFGLYTCPRNRAMTLTYRDSFYSILLLLRSCCCYYLCFWCQLSPCWRCGCRGDSDRPGSFYKLIHVYVGLNCRGFYKVRGQGRFDPRSTGCSFCGGCTKVGFCAAHRSCAVLCAKITVWFSTGIWFDCRRAPIKPWWEAKVACTHRIIVEETGI